MQKRADKNIPINQYLKKVCISCENSELQANQTKSLIQSNFFQEMEQQDIERWEWRCRVGNTTLIFSTAFQNNFLEQIYEFPRCSVIFECDSSIVSDVELAKYQNLHFHRLAACFLGLPYHLLVGKYFQASSLAIGS